MSRSPATDSASDELTDDLLIELGCEELPPRALDQLRDSMFTSVCDGLTREGLAFDTQRSQAWSTPRRLALFISQVAAAQPDLEQERRGPAIAAAFDDTGAPTKAAIGFARSVGREVTDLDTLENDQGAWLAVRLQVTGKPLGELIFPILEQAIRQLPIPRPMRWSDHEFSFIRPVHWLVVMHGDRVLPGNLLGQSAGNETRGHRIHSPGPHRLTSAGDYLDVLESAFVLASQERRSEVIAAQSRELEPQVLIQDALLDEVKNLVEWPVAVGCSFDEAFLSVPHQALIASMQDHQKFFPVLAEVAQPEADPIVTNRFVVIANLESTNVDAVREGFERVIRPRLADARFFLEQDQKQPLSRYLDGLDQIIFQNKIGSIGDKSRRIAALSKKIAAKYSVDEASCERAARLSKADLMSLMVGEFPELQGTMGRYYALYHNEPEAVAVAIEQHYQPRFAGDLIPATQEGQVVGMADRADTLVAIFASGQRPSGNKDPFALRRSALGLVRILLEGDVSVPLSRLLAMAANELTAQSIDIQPALLAEVQDFVSERARHHFREAGYATELVNAALASDWDTFRDLEARLSALAGFMGDDTGASLAAANKRIGNILKKSEDDFSNNIDDDRLILDEEAELYRKIKSVEIELKPRLADNDYAGCLARLAQLRPLVDAFFDSVMVMDDDLELRRNRLALLARLKAQFDQIADLSVLG